MTVATETREAFICDALRTPIGRYGGVLSSVRPDDLLAHVLKGLVTRHSDLDPSSIDDVIIGCANQAGEDNRNIARMSVLLAGLPESVPASTINRLCGSGLEAAALAARAIRCGEADLMIAGGVESMSRAPYVVGKSDAVFSRSQRMEDTSMGWRLVNPRMQAMFGIDSMPETAENVAEQYQISRKDQDAFALRSQKRAVQAQASGRFAAEILPVPVPRRKADPLVVDTDEHPRADTSAEKLVQLPTPFRTGGTVTAGNSSGINDGAAALIIASKDAAHRHGLTPKARIVASSMVGVAPRIMGIGPVSASKRLMSRTGCAISDYDVIELNEAFAAQSLAVLRLLGLPDDAEHVNPNGGAIALGHPLGMSGTRLVQTLSEELMQRGERRGLASMCIGVGQGIAMALERV